MQYVMVLFFVVRKSQLRFLCSCPLILRAATLLTIRPIQYDRMAAAAAPHGNNQTNNVRNASSSIFMQRITSASEPGGDKVWEKLRGSSSSPLSGWSLHC